jgi:hypothetical protein
MTRSFHSSLTLLGPEFVVAVARQQFDETDLPAAVRARCVARFADRSLEQSTAALRLHLLAELGSRRFSWPRLQYWRDYFEALGAGRPRTWTRSIFPVEWRGAVRQTGGDTGLKTRMSPVLSLQEEPSRPPVLIRRTPVERRKLNLKLEERHHAALVGLLEHYVRFICYAERDRRQIVNLGAEPCLMLSKDAVEQRIERFWIEGRVDNEAMWRAAPPLFPGHSGTLRALSMRRGLASVAVRAAARPIWYVNA